MSCEVWKRLRREEEHHREEWAYFAHSPTPPRFEARLGIEYDDKFAAQKVHDLTFRGRRPSPLKRGGPYIPIILPAYRKLAFDAEARSPKQEMGRQTAREVFAAASARRYFVLLTIFRAARRAAGRYHPLCTSGSVVFVEIA